MYRIGLLQCISSAAAVTLLLRCVFGYARAKRYTAFGITLCIAAVSEAAVLFFARRGADAASYLQDVMILACTIAFPYTLLRHGRKSTFFLFGLIYGATADYIAVLIPVRCTGVVYVIIDVFVCLFALWMRKSGKQAPPDFLEHLPVWSYITVFVAEWSAYYSWMLSRDASYFESISAVLKLLSLILTGAGAALIVRRFLAAKRAAQEADERLAAQLRHYEELVEKNRSVRAFRHDYVNNLLSIGAILDAGETEQAREYVRQLQGGLHGTAYTYTTGNYLADAILSDKDAAAESKSIRIAFTGTVPEKGVGNPDVCTILCNLLDNAIRGSEPCAPCTIELEGRESADRWLLTVKNPVAQKVVIRGGTIRTSKADRENHGIGLANVRRAAEKYNGYTELQCDDRCFTAEIGLMLNTEEIK